MFKTFDVIPCAMQRGAFAERCIADTGSRTKYWRGPVSAKQYSARAAHRIAHGMTSRASYRTAKP